MTMPEKGTPEWNVLWPRVESKMMTLGSAVALRNKLPFQILIMVVDEPTGEIFGAYAGVEYMRDNGMHSMTRTSISKLKAGVPVSQIADGLIERQPGTALVCDEKIAEELGRESLTWYESDHYSLQGRPNGTLDVYTPHKTHEAIPKEQLPEGVHGVHVFDE